jgi:hypothetical protein
VALSWSGFSDANSGVANYKLLFVASSSPPASCTSGTALSVGPSTSFTHTGLTNGTTYSYRVCATDHVGNVSVGVTATARPASEFTPPTGTVNINNGAAFTRSTSATLSLFASDASGVSGMCISSTSSCTSFTAFSASKVFSLPAGSGVKTVNVWFKDTQGNVSTTPASDTITLDTTLPTDGTFSSSQSAGQVALQWTSAADTPSGVAGYKLVFAISATAPATCNSGTVAYAGTALSFTHTGLTNGSTYSYRLCALDVAGNVSTGKTLSARPALEYKPPTGTLVINNGAAFTGNASVTLSLNATDSSGISQVCLSSTTTCTSFVAFSATKTFTLSAGGGLKTVNAWFKDTQGNISTTPASDSITLDITRPNDGNLNTNSSSSQIQLSWSAATDVGSGVASYKLVFTIGNTAPATCSAGTVLYSGSNLSFLHSGLSAATKYNYRVCAIDNVGNVSYGRAFSFVTP